MSANRQHYSNLFRINTCKTVPKQTTLTLFRMNTYEKHRGEGGGCLFTSLLHYFVASLLLL